MVASLLGYSLLPLWMPLLPFYNRLPLADIRTFAPSPLTAVLYAVWLCSLFLFYWLAFRVVRWRKRPFSLRAILIFTSLFAALLLFTFPYNATDLYRYVIRGRVSSVYQQSPFDTPSNQFPADPLAAYAGEWAEATSPYGPVWELSASLLTRLSGENLLAGLLLFKSLAAVTFLLNTLLIWALLAGQETAVRSAYTLLWGWNPALLLIFIADGHNDGLMILWLLLGLWIMRRGYPAAGFVVMLLAPLTKAIGVLALPFFFLAAIHALPDWKGRARFVLLVSLGAAGLVLLTFLPFGSPLALAKRLLFEIVGAPGFSFGALLLLGMQSAGLPITLGLLNSLSAVFTATAVLLGLWLLWLTGKGRPAGRSVADIFGLYILQAFSFRIWYAAWPFPWLLLEDVWTENGRFTYRLRVGIWFLLTSQLAVLIYGHLRIYALGGNHTLAHLIGAPFTFGLPFLLAKIGPTRA